METRNSDEKKVIETVLEIIRKNPSILEDADAQKSLLRAVTVTSTCNPEVPQEDVKDDDVKDITAIPEQELCLVDNPKNLEGIMAMKRHTPAATATGRTGAREKTLTRMRKIAALAAAVDTVWSPLDEEFVNALGIPVITSLPKTREEYLMRPDWGRLLDEENMEIVRTGLKKNPDVQIVIGEGQSMFGLAQNLHELLPALRNGLEGNHIDYGTPIFVKHTRVGIGDLIAQEVGASMVCVILGERPGLTSWSSLSCYLTYGAYPYILESKRTVVSNINDGGTPAAEAGAYVADLIKLILEKQLSGVDLVI